MKDASIICLEYVNGAIKKITNEEGIRHQRTVPYTPEQNGCSERDNRTLMEAARTLILSKNLAAKFWAEAVNTAVYVLNRSGKSTMTDKTPYELWHGKRSSINHMQIFGSDVFVHIPKEKRNKLSAKSAKCIFIGYDENVKGYRVWNPETNKVQVARDVIFLIEEQVSIKLGNSSSETKQKDVLDTFNSEEKPPAVGADENTDIPVADIPVKGSTCEADEANVINNRLRERHAHHTCCCDSTNHFAMTATGEEPRTYEQAIHAVDSDQWKHAMNEEYDSLIKNHTWALVKPPADQKVIDNRWIYKVKQNTDGSTERFKARLVVRGFTQEYGIDYQETFSPVVKFTSIRTILALAASRRMKLKHFDVKTAFLNGDLDDVVFISAADWIRRW